ncbi:MAG: 6-phosphogluconolactonase [Steroidobacteraceae bacterium]
MSAPELPRILTRRFADRDALLDELAARLAHALTESGPRAVMLSGGSTPMPAYRAVAARAVVPAPQLYVFFSDDRYVPSTSEASNYHQSQALLDALALPAEQVLRVRTELPLDAAADDYERRLAELAGRGVRCRLGLLGLGADGHTASLFDTRDLTRAAGHRALPVHRPDGRDAVSVSPAVLADVAQLVFVVAGAQKRSALAALLARDPALTASRAVATRAAIEVWTEPEALPAP